MGCCGQSLQWTRASPVRGVEVNDFVLAPENMRRRKQIMLEQNRAVRKAFGEARSFLSVIQWPGCAAREFCRVQVQRELPIWITGRVIQTLSSSPGELAGKRSYASPLAKCSGKLQTKLAIYRSELRKEHGLRQRTSYPPCSINFVVKTTSRPRKSSPPLYRVPPPFE